MVSRAVRIFSLLLLASGTSAAHDQSRPLRQAAGDSFESSRRARELGDRGVKGSIRAAELRRPQHRDHTGRVWSKVDLEVRQARSADGWTTQQVGGWSYSYSNDGTSCFSQRTPHGIFISCQ